MNPFLHPAVATPLEPDDVPIWRSDAADVTPETVDEKELPAETGGAGQTGKARGPRPAHARSGPGSCSLRGVVACLDRRSSQAGAHGMKPPMACLPARRPSSVWQRRLRSFAVASAVALGICGSVAAQPVQVNANVATAAELEAIKGIGPKTARNIVSERQRSGPFESFQDFSERIRGIGARRAAALRAAGLVIGLPASRPLSPAPPAPGAGGAPVGVLVR